MSEPAHRADVPVKDSLFSEVRRLHAVFWRSRERNQLLLLGAGLVVVVAATAYMQIQLNAWNRPFYDALTHKEVPEFLRQLVVFAEIAAVLLVLNVGQVRLNQTLRVVLRQGLVHDLLDEWLKPLRAFRLSHAGVIGQNPDQRLAADAQHLTDLVTDLSIGLLQATLLLLSFVGVLWVLSEHMTLPLGGRHVRVHGYMVWCALFYAATASFLSWWVGRPLIPLNAERYAREAELRYALVRVNEEIEGITIYGGEADEKQMLYGVFDTVLQVSRRIVAALTRLTWVTAGYGWFTIVAPILVAAPSYLSGDMSFGELMVAVGAFNQVQSSLRWFVDNFSQLADWRATRRRVATFHRATATMDDLGESGDRIDLEITPGDSIRIDDLCIAAPDSSLHLSEEHVELKPGEHALIAGEHGSTRALLLRALIGIWPWGRGRIARPARDSMMFLPERAYVPPGTLRAALAYPHAPGTYDEAAITRALAAVGLEHLSPSLDVTDRWDRRLNEDEKQTLAFARVVLQRPKWLVVNGAFEQLDASTRSVVEALFAGPLAGIGLIRISQDGENPFFTRKLRLVTDPHGPTFNPADHCAMPAT
ncbi:MAG TPA: ABC transporter ATP-binding protein/permease [Steroidobacteraceae bacterium]|nr:ABC transporter ATP-binding protein/permease [Steroidobacteraceae bacterium]